MGLCGMPEVPSRSNFIARKKKSRAEMRRKNSNERCSTEDPVKSMENIGHIRYKQ
jgi:hypothetical protein